MGERERASHQRARYWDEAYARRGAQGVSWYQDLPTVSLDLIDALGVRPTEAVIDVGGGGSTLVDQLVARGLDDVTVLDFSAAAIDEGRRRLANAPVTWVHEDVLLWQPDRRFGLWHDRATFHFLVTAGDRDRYLQVLRSAMQVGGFVVLATFAADGPEKCSGLPVARYSPDDLTQALGTDFELLETRREEHVTPRGAVQPFTWVAGRMSAA